MEEPKQMREMVRIVDKTKNPKSPEDRVYLICIRGKDGAEDEWSLETGRRAAYEFIKDRVEYIDFEESFILVETLTLNDRRSIPKFMQYCAEYFEDGFDIQDYIRGDWDEDDFMTQTNEISPEFEEANNDRLSMVDILSGGVTSKPLD